MRVQARSPQWLSLLVLSLIALPCVAAAATRTVTGVQTSHHDAQSFVTWNNLPGTHWRYHVYRTMHPMVNVMDMEDADELGSVGDSSAVDFRISSLLGTLLTYRTDSTAAALAPSRGAFNRAVLSKSRTL